MDYDFSDFDWYSDVQLPLRIMNWTIFAVFVVSNLAVLIYLKFKIGYWGYFTFSMHFVAFLLRVLTPNFEEDYYTSQLKTIYALSSTSQTLIWTSLYNFTF